MMELHQALEPLINTEFLVPTPLSFPFTRRRSLNTSPLLHPKARRTYYLSIPRRKLPALTRANLIRNIKHEVKDKGYNLVHFNWAFPEMLALPDIKELGVPVFLTFHGHLFFEIFGNPELRAFLSEAVEKADRIFMVGKKLNEQICERFPFIRDKSFHLPNGIDESKFYITNRSAAQDTLGWDPGKTHILCVGNIASEKGIDVLIDAAIREARLNEVQVHIIGRVIDRGLLTSCKKNIAQSGAKNIHFHGPVPHSELPLYYNAADAYVQPSRSEGFGVALVEAGMCGLPLISTYSGGPEQIVLPENGVLVEAGNADALANAMLKLLENPGQYSPETIRETMVSRYSRSKVVAGLLSHYKEFIQR